MIRPKTPSKRRHQRRTSYIVAEYSVQEGVFRDIIKNISAGGLFVSTKRSIAVNQAIILKFPLFDFDQEIQARGRVVRNMTNGFAVQFDSAIKDLICEDGEFPPIIHEADRLMES